MLAALLPYTVITYSILTILKRRYSELARVFWVLYDLSWQHKADKHLIDLWTSVILEISILVRVLRVISEVGALSTIAKLGEADVEAIFTLVDDFRRGTTSTRAMEEELDELRWALIRILFTVVDQFIDKVLLNLFVFELQN